VVDAAYSERARTGGRMAKILVTGGLGTVGNGLVKELTGRGHHVVSCDLYH